MSSTYNALAKIQRMAKQTYHTASTIAKFSMGGVPGEAFLFQIEKVCPATLKRFFKHTIGYFLPKPNRNKYHILHRFHPAKLKHQ
jgi:hypothetical protein